MMESLNFQESSIFRTRFHKSFTFPYFFVIFNITFVFIVRHVEGRRCYSCSTVSESEKFDCLHNVEQVTTTENWNNNITLIHCPYFCTIRRQEYADIPGGVNYLNRSCEETKLDEVISNGYFVTYLRSCKSDLCNAGDGLSSLKDLPVDADDVEIELEIQDAGYSENNEAPSITQLNFLILYLPLEVTFRLF